MIAVAGGLQFAKDMQVPLELTFRDVQKTEELEALIHQHVERLERFCDHLMSCRVALEVAHQHQGSVRHYRIRLDLTLPPGKELVVTRESDGNLRPDDLFSLTRDAFHAVERRLRKVNERQQGKFKVHPEQEVSGVVEKLFDDYGFLRTVSDEEVYFHRNSVLSPGFEQLRVGSGVAYTLEEGDEGPQASSVRVMDGRGGLRSKERFVSAE